MARDAIVLESKTPLELMPFADQRHKLAILIGYESHDACAGCEAKLLFTAGSRVNYNYQLLLSDVLVAAKQVVRCSHPIYVF